MSKAKLKKCLAAMDKEEIISMVMELYDARKEAKEYLEYWQDPDAEKELEKCKLAISRLFFTSSGVSRRTPSLTSITKILKDFMSICFEPTYVADLLLWIVQTECEWLNVKSRRAPYRASLKKYVNEATLYIETHELESQFGLKLERLRESAAAIEEWQSELPARRFRRRW